MKQESPGLGREECQSIQEAARRLQRLVDDLLDFARLEAGTFRLVPREVDIKALVKEMLLSLEPQFHESQQKLVMELPESPVCGHVDPDRLGQVLLNLAGNAIKFTPKGGRITVRLTTGENQIRIEVQDEGIGIKREDLPHVFEKFFQSDPSLTRERGGAGLGLSICRALVNAHGAAPSGSRCR